MMRKGLTAGSGRKGYYNVIGKDPMVHSQSARGIKQPQRIPQIPTKKRCPGYRIVSFPDPYFPGETYTEHIDCYCDECVRGGKRELRDELEVPGHVNMYKVVTKEDLLKEAREIMKKAESYGANTPNQMKEEDRKRLGQILNQLGVKTEFGGKSPKKLVCQCGALYNEYEVACPYCAKANTKRPKEFPIVLPRITIDGKEWIIDERLNEVRNAKKPWERMSLDEAAMLAHLERKAHGGKYANKDLYNWGDFWASTKLESTNYKGSTIDYRKLPIAERKRLQKLEKELKDVTTIKAIKSGMKKVYHDTPIIVTSNAAGFGAACMNPTIGVPLAAGAVMFEAEEVGKLIKADHRLFSKTLKQVRKDFPSLTEKQKRELAIRIKTQKQIKGGKLPFGRQGIDVYELPVENAVYVPSTDKDQRQISNQDFADRITKTEDFLAKLYGGYTKVEHDGGFSDNGKIIRERGARVVSYATKEDAADRQKSQQLKRFLTDRRKDWGQIAIGLENEGDLYYISKKEKK